MTEGPAYIGRLWVGNLAVHPRVPVREEFVFGPRWAAAGGRQASSSRCSSIRAFAQSRCTVRTVTPNASSVVVLSQYYPLTAATLETQLDADLAAQGWPGRKNQDATSGEAVGRAVGAAVLAQAATDNYLAVVPPTQPPGPGKWAPLPNPVRSLFGVRPFFLTSADQIRPGPPPAFGSAEYLTALAEIRGISDTRTTEQLSIAQTWAFGAAPFTAGAENLIADQFIAEHHRNEKDAARILAYANAAAFDAQIACWDAKFFYYFIRPTQADPAITVAVPLPNHPSYPSGHACITGAISPC